VKVKVASALLIVAMAVVAVALLSDPEPQAVTTPQMSTMQEEQKQEELQRSTQVDQLWGLDPNRLFDRGYENDPQVQAIAERLNVSPGCVIDQFKVQVHDTEPTQGACPRMSLSGGGPAKQVDPGVDHPYQQYSNSELEQLANSSAEAAVILARRLQNDKESEKFYERATVLSGSPEPLMEWMITRDTGGLEYENNRLNVEKAQEGYETYLVAAAFGLSDKEVLTYREKLVEADVDLARAEAEAAERVEKLMAQRSAIYKSRGEN
jgi:hypothetical protein